VRGLDHGALVERSSPDYRIGPRHAANLKVSTVGLTKSVISAILYRVVIRSITVRDPRLATPSRFKRLGMNEDVLYQSLADLQESDKRGLWVRLSRRAFHHRR
jgi:hypothetical protein